MGDLAEIMEDVLADFSTGLAMYLRVRVETGGSDLYDVPGSEGDTDYVIVPRPVLRRLTASDALADSKYIGDFKLVLIYNSTITKTLFASAYSILIGGSYNAETHTLTGGEEFVISQESKMPQYLDLDNPTVEKGTECICSFRGNA